MYLKKGLKKIMFSALTIYDNTLDKVSENFLKEAKDDFKKRISDLHKLDLTYSEKNSEEIRYPKILTYKEVTFNVCSREILDKKLSWEFSSGFSNLIYNLGLNSENSIKIFDDLLIYKLSVACNYLLSGEWSDTFENCLHNEWVDNLSESSDTYGYFKYLYRRDLEFLQKLLKDEDDYVTTLTETNLKKLKTALDAYLSCCEVEYSSESDKPILVYQMFD